MNKRPSIARLSPADRKDFYARGNFQQLGISLEKGEYTRRMAANGGRCAICPRHAEELDHNHDTLTVREGLCDRCNRGLALFAEDPNRLRAALAYLERHDEVPYLSQP